MELEKIDSKNFEEKVTKTNNLVLIDFFATWCGPCRMLSPILESVKEELSSKADMKVDMYKLDIDADLDIAKTHNVLSVPTLLIFKDGEEVNRLVGLRKKSQIISTLEKILKK